MRKMVVALCAVSVLSVAALGGCGPRELTPAEQKAQARRDAEHARQEKAKQEHDSIVAARKTAQANAAKLLAQQRKAQAEHQQRVAVYRQQQLGKRPLPAGVVQLSSTRFLVDYHHASNGRYLCSGRVVNADNSTTRDKNDVADISHFDATHLLYECNWPVRKYRDAGFRP